MSQVTTPTGDAVVVEGTSYALDEYIMMDVAAQLGRGNVTTLYRRITAGELPALRQKGKRTYVRVRDVLTLPLTATVRRREDVNLVDSARRIAAAAPRLTDGQKLDLRNILSPVLATEGTEEVAA